MRTRFTKAAESDVGAVGDWIAEDNPSRATSFVLDMKACRGTEAVEVLRIIRHARDFDRLLFPSDA